MLFRVIRAFVGLIGLVVGFVLAKKVLVAPWLPVLLGQPITQDISVAVYVLIILLCGIIFYFLFPLLHSWVKKLTAYIEQSMENVRLADIVIACAGLVIGMLIALLISFAVSLIPIPWLSSLISVIVYIILGYLGFNIALHKRDDILNILQFGKKEKEITAPKKTRKKGQSKLLDTSAIIDGRILDVSKTGFLEGQLIVPVFVLAELQLLADSSEDLKRKRGRRGLEILKKMQEDEEELIIISETDYDDIKKVDEKLIRMAKAKKLSIITDDYNLNQVATVQGISVLNINELAGALKPVVIPGEQMEVMPVKKGKESGQAVAYLDDGTMIVVENGRSAIGKTISVAVTSVLQTAAGRMIFARPEHYYGKRE